MKKNPLKIVLFIIWMIAIGTFITFLIRSGLKFCDLQTNIIDLINRWSAVAPIVYIIIYVIRPLIFFPATLLTALSGALFGPFWGIIYTILGENLSANASFLVGKYFGKSLMQELTKKSRLLSFTDCKFRDHGFSATLVMRLTFMPFDMVSYMAGICDLKQIDFAIGTFIGIIPGLVTFVLLGSSFSDPKNLALSFLMLLLGLTVSYFLKKRSQLAKKALSTQQDDSLK